ncbi:GNAT family N-acetyltransferase [Fusibacter sp. JL216-2]|uniref:GNAT family N-acetyltransferase n=1 Tax=Fusibacter sp. JL216-2 TaxID=3071453 RepID=UPI003D35623E
MKRIKLRPFKESDWQDLHEYLSNPDVVKYEPYSVHTKEESLECARDRSKSDAFYAIEEKSLGKVIGNLYMAPFGPKDYKTWMIGYVLGENYWKKGYASEAVQLLLKELFMEKNVHRVIAMCNTQNVASWKLLENNGFRREGAFKKIAYFSKDESGQPNWHDSYMYAMLYEEWEKIDEGIK